VYVAAAGASVSLAVGGGMMALRSPADVEGAHAVSKAPEINSAPDTAPAPAQSPERAEPAALPETEPNEARYAVLTASFPIADLLREGSAAAARFNSVVGELRQLGYDVRSMDVTVRDRGEWRRVLVGEFATLSDAKAEADRVHQTPAFANAQVIRY
jgi:cell division septation protein DedD